MRRAWKSPVCVAMIGASDCVVLACTGARTVVGLVHGFENWLICSLIIGVACLGNFGGSFLAGQLSGLDWRQGASVRIPMNTLDLKELIPREVGLHLGGLSSTLFTMLGLMALATTAATTPILNPLTGSADPLPAGETESCDTTTASR